MGLGDELKKAASCNIVELSSLLFNSKGDFTQLYNYMVGHHSVAGMFLTEYNEACANPVFRAAVFRLYYKNRMRDSDSFKSPMELLYMQDKEALSRVYNPVEVPTSILGYLSSIPVGQVTFLYDMGMLDILKIYDLCVRRLTFKGTVTVPTTYRDVEVSADVLFSDSSLRSWYDAYAACIKKDKAGFESRGLHAFYNFWSFLCKRYEEDNVDESRSTHNDLKYFE